MNDKKRKMLIGLLVLFGICITAIGTEATDPTMEIYPEKPAPGSTVAFTAEVTDENVTGVWLLFNECKSGDLCYVRQNVSMDPIGDDKYEVEVTLEHEDATYIQYWLEVETSDGWQEYLKISKVYLEEKQNGGNSNNGDGEDKDTPGFEFIGVIISAMFILLIIYKRKR